MRRQRLRYAVIAATVLFGGLATSALAQIPDSIGHNGESPALPYHFTECRKIAFDRVDSCRDRRIVGSGIHLFIIRQRFAASSRPKQDIS